MIRLTNVPPAPHLSRAASGVSILVVEQFARTALRVSDYAAVMQGGRVVATGEPDEILELHRERHRARFTRPAYREPLVRTSSPHQNRRRTRLRQIEFVALQRRFTEPTLWSSFVANSSIAGVRVSVFDRSPDRSV